MWSDYFRAFAKSPLLLFPLASLAIFGAMFAAVLVWIAWRGRALESHGHLPLTDDEGQS